MCFIWVRRHFCWISLLFLCLLLPWLCTFVAGTWGRGERERERDVGKGKERRSEGAFGVAMISILEEGTFFLYSTECAHLTFSRSCNGSIQNVQGEPNLLDPLGPSALHTGILVPSLHLAGFLEKRALSYPRGIVRHESWKCEGPGREEGMGG